MISETDLILNPDGSIYHLNLLPEDIGDIVITVGDPDRVSQVSAFFDQVELRKGKREFITHTGYVGKKRTSVISTGIGTDNIDIVLNELDALVNLDLQSRLPKKELKSLEIIRIGTSGAVQANIAIDSILISTHAVGLDSLMHYYSYDLSEEERKLSWEIQKHFAPVKGISPYVAAGSADLINKYGAGLKQGITVTAPGFYAPQGRATRIGNNARDLVALFKSFKLNEQRIANLEMETAGIYALANIFGHKAISVNAILARRIEQKFSSNPKKVIESAIKIVLEKM